MATVPDIGESWAGGNAIRALDRADDLAPILDGARAQGHSVLGKTEAALSHADSSLFVIERQGQPHGLVHWTAAPDSAILEWIVSWPQRQGLGTGAALVLLAGHFGQASAVSVSAVSDGGLYLLNKLCFEGAQTATLPRWVWVQVESFIAKQPTFGQAITRLGELQINE